MTGGFWCSPVIGNVTCHSRFSPFIMTGMTGLGKGLIKTHLIFCFSKQENKMTLLNSIIAIL